MTQPLSSRLPLPIDDVIEDLLTALEKHSNAVLVAEPGAGKTTRVPLALLDASWRGDGKIILLEPRRLAARAAARRMAFELGEKVGDRVGYRVRLDSKVSAQTRIEVVTEGVFTRMILDDPELTGIAAVLFDEFHERSLDGDLGLALALDVQSALRDDLRLLPMSATLDAAKVSETLGGAPVIESKGRSFPVETRYLGRTPKETIEDAMAKAIVKALAEETGSILSFLPGQKEILRTAERLKGKLPANAIIAPLYGALESRAQDAAIQPAQKGIRKVVLASAIAQTSLTIEGIRVVVDGGLARVPRYEPQTGLTRLETVRVSRASANQRRGRAGRTEAGVCYRLWDQAQTAALPANEAPEILEADLAGLVLDLASWGTLNPDQLSFPDAPPAPAWTEASTLLKSLNAITAQGHLTQNGRYLARLPLHPRLAHMILQAAASDDAWTAALIAAAVSEPGLGGRDVDLRTRISRISQDSSPRAKDARRLAERWLSLAGGRKCELKTESCGRLLALAYPDRVAEARGKAGRYRLANGRGAELEEGHPLCTERFLTIADIQGKAANGRIALSAPLLLADIENLFGDKIYEVDEVTLEKSGKLKAKRLRKYENVVLESRIISNPNPEAITQAFLNEIRKKGINRLPWSNDQLRLRGRIEFVRANGATNFPDVSDEALSATLADWLGPFLRPLTSLDELSSDILGNALSLLVPYEAVRQLEEAAPSHFTAPTGSRLPIDYGKETGPTLSVRVQELFGLIQHPTVCNGTLPLTLELLSPAHRPIQITKDLPGFWAGSWADVKADMRGRYPKHPWPDDPTKAEATRRVKVKPC